MEINKEWRLVNKTPKRKIPRCLSSPHPVCLFQNEYLIYYNTERPHICWA